MSKPDNDPLEETFDSEQAWDMLAEQLDALIEKWEGGTPPPLHDFLPDGPRGLRQLVLVELIKVDLEQRWQSEDADKWTLDHYIQEHAELADSAVPPDLIYEEFHIRRLAGDPVTPESIYKRFPDQREQLAKLMEDVEATQTTQVSVTTHLAGIEPGGRIDDFELISLLGQGAFAKVFLARQESMQRLVALKISADRGTEPQTLARLDHPNIVRVFDLRTLPERKIRLLYMQYVPGGTLKEVVDGTRTLSLSDRAGKNLLKIVDDQLESRGVIPPARSEARRELDKADWPETVCRLGIQMALGLSHAHQEDVLHRDLKPANVLVTSEGIPLLADFNISFSGNVEGATPAAYFGGSLAYMSPEQLESCHPGKPRTPAELDARSDIYSLGIVLAELLMGRRPFSDSAPNSSWTATLETLMQQRETVPPILSKPSEDPRLTHLYAVIAKCIAPDREDRWRNGQQVAQQLRVGLYPRALKLLNPPASHWSRWIARFPVAIFLIALLIPTGLAAFANKEYNEHEIELHHEAALDTFTWIHQVINWVTFPVGLTLAGIMIWQVHRALCETGELELERARRLRRRALNLPHLGALLCVVLWLIAGAFYAGGFGIFEPDASSSLYTHFFSSLTLTGLVAAAYPFFTSALIALPGIYAPLVIRSTNTTGDGEALDALGRRVEFYLYLAASMPFLTIIPLAAIGNSPDKNALLLCSVTGLVGFALAFLARVKLQRDINALKLVVENSDE